MILWVLFGIAYFLRGRTERTSKLMSELPGCFLHSPHSSVQEEELRTHQSQGKVEQSKTVTPMSHAELQ